MIKSPRSEEKGPEELYTGGDWAEFKGRGVMVHEQNRASGVSCGKTWAMEQQCFKYTGAQRGREPTQ